MKMKKTIYLNSGHDTNSDPGAIFNGIEERNLNIAISKKLIPLLKQQGFKVEYVPDNLNLVKSIEWVNKKVKNINDGLALSIHCNCCKGNGAETFYYKQNVKSNRIAKKLIQNYCKETGLKNRGAKSDTQIRFGKLGWIRETKIWAVLIECFFMSNKQEMDFAINNFDKIAYGIAKGVCSIYDIPYKEKKSIIKIEKQQNKIDFNKLKEIQKLANQIIDLTNN